MSPQHEIFLFLLACSSPVEAGFFNRCETLFVADRPYIPTGSELLDPAILERVRRGDERLRLRIELVEIVALDHAIELINAHLPENLQSTPLPIPENIDLTNEQIWLAKSLGEERFKTQLKFNGFTYQKRAAKNYQAALIKTRQYLLDRFAQVIAQIVIL